MAKYDLSVKLPRQPGVLQFREFIEFCGKVQRLDGPAKLLVDLSGVRFAHPSGMAPLVALVQHLTEHRWEFDVALPNDDFLADYFYKAGWVAGIMGDEPTFQVLPGSTFTQLSRYDSADELNPMLTDALSHFANHSVFSAGVLEGMEWAMNEVADNVLNHAGGVSGWLQLAEQPKKGLIEIVVADCGRGIYASLKERFPELRDDRDALRMAVEKGVTRDPNIGQGNGLAGTLRIAIAARGWVNLYSGRGLLRYKGETAPTYDRGPGRAPGGAAQGLTIESGPNHAGTVLSLTLPTRRGLDVTEALWGRPHSSVFENTYFSDDGQRMVFVLANEASGFGNRDSARPLRHRLHNLMNVFPDDPVIVDFDGVNLVSASFADELIARLAKDVGVATFFQRVQLSNMNDLVRRTLDAVLEQRLRE